jgi:hypothetical protein
MQSCSVDYLLRTSPSPVDGSIPRARVRASEHGGKSAAGASEAHPRSPPNLPRARRCGKLSASYQAPHSAQDRTGPARRSASPSRMAGTYILLPEAVPLYFRDGILPFARGLHRHTHEPNPPAKECSVKTGPFAPSVGCDSSGAVGGRGPAILYRV